MKKTAESIVAEAEKIAEDVVKKREATYERDRKIDKILTSKKFGIPIMIVLLALIFG